MYAWELKDLDPTEEENKERDDEEPSAKKQKTEAKRVCRLILYII